MTSTQVLHRYYLQAVPDRPQFRSVVALLFPTGVRIDTDGDAIPASSTTWTWLSIRRSDKVIEAIEIYLKKQTPLSLVIESKSSELAARVAYHLAKSMAFKKFFVALQRDGKTLLSAPGAVHRLILMNTLHIADHNRFFNRDWTYATRFR